MKKKTKRIPDTFEGLKMPYTTKRLFSLYKTTTYHQTDSRGSFYNTVLYCRKKSIRQLPSSSSGVAASAHKLLDRLAWMKVVDIRSMVAYSLITILIMTTFINEIYSDLDVVKEHFTLITYAMTCGFATSFLLISLFMRSFLFNKMTDKILQAQNTNSIVEGTWKNL